MANEEQAQGIEELIDDGSMIDDSGDDAVDLEAIEVEEGGAEGEGGEEPAWEQSDRDDYRRLYGAEIDELAPDRAKELLSRGRRQDAAFARNRQLVERANQVLAWAQQMADAQAQQQPAEAEPDPETQPAQSILHRLNKLNEQISSLSAVERERAARDYQQSLAGAVGTVLSAVDESFAGEVAQAARVYGAAGGNASQAIMGLYHQVVSSGGSDQDFVDHLGAYVRQINDSLGIQQPARGGNSAAAEAQARAPRNLGRGGAGGGKPALDIKKLSTGQLTDALDKLAAAGVDTISERMKKLLAS